MPERRLLMISKYEIGDTVILTGTVSRIEQSEAGYIKYILLEYDGPVMEQAILGKVEAPWRVVDMGGIS